MTTTVTADRIPPLSEPLEFARNTKTCRVHILCGGEARDWIPNTRMNAEASAILGLVSSPCRMICGAKMLVSSAVDFPAVWEAGSSFADDELCDRCVQGLGDQSWRAFHEDNRGADCDRVP